jgi:membrane protein
MPDERVQSQEASEAGGGRGIVDRAKAVLAAARRRSRLFDHTLDMNTHYGNVQGGVLAGAVTYFGFLSFFPLLALAFAVVGYVARWYPDAEDSLVTAIQQVFPGIVTVHGSHNTISMDQIKSASNIAGIIGFFGVLYSGLGWVSGLRQGLQAAFQVPPSEKYNFIKGKAVDLVALVVLGLVLIVSVGISGLVNGLAGRVIGWIGLGGSWIGGPVVWLVGIALGIAASSLLFLVMYRILGEPDVDAGSLWHGALLAAIGFEILKQLVVNVLGAVGGSSFAPLAIAVTLMVWINYFSRLVMYGAAWAMTDDRSADELALQAARRLVAEQAAKVEADSGVAMPVGQKPAEAVAGLPNSSLAARFDLGSAIAGAAAAVVATVVFWRQN